MGKALTDFAMQTGQGIVGGLTGLAFGAINDRRQLRQQKKLQRLEIEGNKELSDYNYANQLQMWKDTNYKAQIEQIKEANLNPALIYGMSGSGGMTGGGAQSVTGAHAPSGGGEGVFMADKAMQIGLMRAQKENIEADTANKQADTANKPLQGEQIKATTGLITVDTHLKALELDFNKGTQESREDRIFYETEMALNALQQSRMQTYIDSNTMQEKIKIIQREAIGAALRNALTSAQTQKTKSDIAVNQAQINKWSEEIMQAWTGLDQGQQRVSQEWQKLSQSERDLKIKQFEAEIRAEFPGISNSFGRIISNAVDEINTLTERVLGQHKRRTVTP